MIWSRSPSVIHSAPWADAMLVGRPPTSNERILPAGVMRQTTPRLPSGAHSAPSGPVVIAFGAAWPAGSGNSTTRGAASAPGAAAARQAVSARAEAASMRDRVGFMRQISGSGAIAYHA